MRISTSVILAFLLLSCTANSVVGQVPNTPPNDIQDAPVTDCDRYAASPTDSGRKAIGVSFEKLDPDVAIPACESAVTLYPESLRLIYQLGRAYHQKQNFNSALIQYRKAAEQGYSVAQFNLGIMNSMGEGTAQNKSEATKWFQKAAEQGLLRAQYNLGIIYDEAQNYAEAMKWYRKAADQGETEANLRIGRMYFEGLGVPQNVFEALVWVRKAADQGNSRAKELFAEISPNTAPAPPASIGPILSSADLPKIVTTYQGNQIRFKRDFFGRKFSDVLPFRSATENMFVRGRYRVDFGTGSFMGDVSCWVSSPGEIATIADWNKGDGIQIEGVVKDVTMGSVELEPCILTK